ncbi:hypothetical protein ACPEEZ_06305 [Frigoribacterium sp. 2-23]|uniref:hypothetical protein n=1 Tax=Frigoribacterium sp. 2-23 TaxID=3415006 RepID=UPI003C6EE85E
MADTRGLSIVTDADDVTRASVDVALPAMLVPGLVTRAVQSSPRFSLAGSNAEGAELTPRSQTPQHAETIRLVFEATATGSRIVGEIRTPETGGATAKHREDDARHLFEAIAKAAGPF